MLPFILGYHLFPAKFKMTVANGIGKITFIVKMVLMPLSGDLVCNTLNSSFTAWSFSNRGLCTYLV